MDANKGGLVCIHCINEENYQYHRQFTGHGVAYNILCNECAKDVENAIQQLHPVDAERFADIEYDCEDNIGQPEIYERQTNLRFEHQTITLNSPLPGTFLDIQPFADHWIAIQDTGVLSKIDFSNVSQQKIIQITPDMLELSDNVALYSSHDQRFVAVVNQRGQYGIVLDLQTSKVCLSLDRGNYHAKESLFPIAFAEHKGHTIAIHGTDWNRLDITDLITGKLLTDRPSPQYNQDGENQDHYLDYFHGKLLVSPDQTWISEAGWVWHPVGRPRTWSLPRWLNDNVWESEDGESIQYLTQRWYYWNEPQCWIDDDVLAVWGFGNDDDWMIPAIQLFDARTGKRIRWFAGPKEGPLYFDTYLFSTSDAGTDVWDIDTGEHLLHAPDFSPTAYNPTSKQFISRYEEGSFRLSHLVVP